MCRTQRTTTLASLASLATVTLLLAGCRDSTAPSPLSPTAALLAQVGVGAALRASGSIGVGDAAPGAFRQDFDVDVSFDLTGHVVFTDWSVVRSGTTVATITVSSSDAATWFSAFREGSSACADPTRGMEVDATGRVDTGELVELTIVACDNGPAGSGVDFFRLTAPNAGGYERAGPVNSGDIVKAAAPSPAGTDVNVRGSGAIGSGPAAAGNDRQEFDFGANAMPAGTLTFTDYSTVRSDGSVLRLTVDQATDPATGVTSLQQTTSACVRFAGTGRLDLGGFSRFYMDVCDNGSSGAGFDTFVITLPDLLGAGQSYRRSGTLSAGDIALAGIAAPATHLAFTVQPSNVSAGSAISPAIRVTAVDDAGKTAEAFTGTITIALGANPGGATLSGTLTATAVKGVATFSDVTITRMGNGYTLTAAAGDLAGATSTSFSVTAGAPRALSFTVQPTSVKAGRTITPAVQVTARDAYGNTAAGFQGMVTIAIGRNPGGGTLSGTRTVSMVNGVATFSDLRIDRAGDGYTLIVNSSGLAGSESARFNVERPQLCLLIICIGL